MDFDYRVTNESNKNFKLMREKSKLPRILLSEADLDNEALQFGKSDENKFSMDIKYPLSLFQALSICISCLDRKIGSK